MQTESNIAAFLGRAALERPNDVAIYAPTGRVKNGRLVYRKHTYKQLDDDSTAIARALTAYGIGRGVRTALMVRPSYELFSITFGLFKAGAIPVLIDPGIGVKRMGKCLADAQPEGFIGIPAAHIARVILGWGKKTISKCVTIGSWRLWGGRTLKSVLKRADLEGKALEKTSAHDDAAILFTSGSTGAPKGVVYQHRHFLAQVELIRETYDIRPGEVDLPTFPLFALFDPALGMTTVIPVMDPTRPAKADPLKLIDAIEQFEITNMFGSPALLNTFGRHGAQYGTRLPSLKRVISAGAPVPADVLDRVIGMMGPNGRVVTPYGATECLPVASIGSEALLGELRGLSQTGAGICVGHPVEPNAVSIIEIVDEPIADWSDARSVAQGEIGEVVVRGPTTTQRYFNRPKETALAKIAHGDDPWRSHRMGDVGYFDEHGRLWFCGRKGHRVETDDGALFTVPCELIFNQHPDVFRTAVVPLDRPDGCVGALCVELEKTVQWSHWPRIKAELLEIGSAHETTKSIHVMALHPGFPVDIRHNAKIGREELAVWIKGHTSL